MTNTNDKTDNSNADTSLVYKSNLPSNFVASRWHITSAMQLFSPSSSWTLVENSRRVVWTGSLRGREEGQKRKTMYATSSSFLALFSVHRVALFPPQ